MTDTWFATWFDSHYYHLLYQHRNDDEAQFFMDNLVQHLMPNTDAKILDLACGKGRHSIYLANKGFDVVGVDLSPESIEHAQQFAHERLQFATHDMRETLTVGTFDYIFNLFTSFGYFPTEEEHVQTLKAMKNGLKDKNSVLVIDFFNAHKVIQNLVLAEEKTLSDITFKLNRRVENGYILKDIYFEDQGKAFSFQESVRALNLEAFKALFEQAGLELVETFGDYNLSAYNQIDSNRLILIAKPC